MEFNERLLKVRKEKKFSQEELACKLGVSRQTISRWEMGKTRPDAESVRKMSEVFQLPIEELLGCCTDNVQINENKKTEEIIFSEEEFQTEQEREQITVIIISIFLLATILIPVIGILSSVVVLVKYKNKKYLFYTKVLSVFCLVHSVQNIYTVLAWYIR